MHKLRSEYKTFFSFKLLLILPIRKLAIKRDTFFVSNAKYKIRKSLFILQNSTSSFVHLTFIMFGRSGAKRSARLPISTVNQKIFMMIQYTPETNEIYDSFKEKLEILPRNQVIRITYLKGIN